MNIMKQDTERYIFFGENVLVAAVAGKVKSYFRRIFSRKIKYSQSVLTLLRRQA